MTIEANDIIGKFGATDDATDGATQAVSDGAFSNDPTTWTNDDNTRLVVFDFKGQYPSGTLDDSPFIALYCRLLNINSTNDETVPSNINPNHYIGNINLDGGLAATTDTYAVSNDLALPAKKASQEYEFYYKNITGVTISAGWELNVTPSTLGPKAA